MLYCVELDHI